MTTCAVPADRLPDELLESIINHYVGPLYRPMARGVCRRWRDTVSCLSATERAHLSRIYPTIVRPTTFSYATDKELSRHRSQYDRWRAAFTEGRLVLASTLASMVAAGPQSALSDAFDRAFDLICLYAPPPISRAYTVPNDNDSDGNDDGDQSETYKPHLSARRTCNRDIVLGNTDQVSIYWRVARYNERYQLHKVLLAASSSLMSRRLARRDSGWSCPIVATAGMVGASIVRGHTDAANEWISNSSKNKELLLKMALDASALADRPEPFMSLLALVQDVCPLSLVDQGRQLWRRAARYASGRIVCAFGPPTARGSPKLCSAAYDTIAHSLRWSRYIWRSINVEQMVAIVSRVGDARASAVLLMYLLDMGRADLAHALISGSDSRQQTARAPCLAYVSWSDLMAIEHRNRGTARWLRDHGYVPQKRHTCARTPTAGMLILLKHWPDIFVDLVSDGMLAVNMVWSMLCLSKWRKADRTLKRICAVWLPGRALPAVRLLWSYTVAASENIYQHNANEVLLFLAVRCGAATAPAVITSMWSSDKPQVSSHLALAGKEQ